MVYIYWISALNLILLETNLFLFLQVSPVKSVFIFTEAASSYFFGSSFPSFFGSALLSLFSPPGASTEESDAWPSRRKRFLNQALTDEKNPEELKGKRGHASNAKGQD